MTAPDASPAPAPAPAAPARRADVVTLSRVSSFLLLAALVLGNVALGAVKVRFDLTEDRIYTLSASSRKVVRGLSDPAQIRVYWGDKVPTKQALVKLRVEGLLDEYESASDGRLKVTWVDMSGSEGKADASEKGVPEVQFQIFGASELTATKDYQGLWIQYEGQTSVFGPLSEVDRDQAFQITSDLEYRITSSLWQMSRRAKPVVGLVKDAPAMPMFMDRGGGDRFSFLGGERVLGGAYKDGLKSWLNLDDPVPDDVTVLVVAAPRQWSDKKAYHLEQFVLRGGKALLLLDAVDVSTLEGRPPSKSGLEDWLKSFGVDLPDGVLADFSEPAMGALYSQDSLFPYPYFVNLLGANMDRDVPALRGLPNVMTFWPTEVLVDAKGQEAAGRKWTPLATTTEKGWRKPDTTGLNLAGVAAEGKTLAKHVVIGMLAGKFTSYWKGKPAPDEPPPPPPKPPEPGMGDDAAMGDAAMGDAATGDAAAMDGAAMDGDASMGEPPAGKPPEPPPAPAMEPEPAMNPEPAMGGAGMGEAPTGPKGPEGEGGDEGPPKSTRRDEGLGVIVIVGDGGLAGNEAAGGIMAFNGRGTGFALVANLVDWLTGDEDVLALRARSAKNRRFEEVGESKATQIRWANYLTAPILVSLVGFVVFFVRRHRR